MNRATDIASQLAQCCPELAADWSVAAADLDVPYVALGHLAGRMVAVDRVEPDVDFRALFQEVERLLAGGDEATRNLLVVGFLESIQNLDGASADRWEPLLGPSTRKAWSALSDLWLGRMTPSAFNKFVDG